MHDSLHGIEYLAYLAGGSKTLVDGVVIMVLGPLDEAQGRDDLGQRGFDLVIQIHAEIFERIHRFVYRLQILADEKLTEEIEKDAER